MKYCFGVDVGGTTVKIGLFQADGVLVDKWEIKTRTENKGEAILPDIAEAIAEKCKKDGIAREDMEADDRQLYFQEILYTALPVQDGHIPYLYPILPT